MIFVLRLSTIPRLIDVRLLGRYTNQPTITHRAGRMPAVSARVYNDVISGWIDNNSTNNNNDNNNNAIHNKTPFCPAMYRILYYIFIVNHNCIMPII